MIKKELNKLFDKYNKKYFENKLTGTKLRIAIFPEHECNCYAYYFPKPSEIYFYNWVLKSCDRNFIICTLLHEMVHAHFRDKLTSQDNHPYIKDINSHDYEFAKKLYTIYKKEFKGATLRTNIKNEVWDIQYQQSNMYEALDYYGIKRYAKRRTKRIL